MSEIPRIITADCSFPKEIDDGLFVYELDEDHELYKVGVCVADTSSAYLNETIKKQAFDRTEAKYYDLPGNERGYDPMFESKVIKSLEFTAGSVKDALIITFLIGAKQPPTEVEINFGKVEVIANRTYKEFAGSAVYGKGGRFLRASNLIRHHLEYVAYGDHVGNQPVWRNDSVSGQAWKRGSKINESYMVAANHLVGTIMKEEGRPAPFRVHDPEDEQYLEIMSTNVARFSRTPGYHSGLNLDPYCRVTSPLRRLDDFVMSHQLRQRFLGKEPTTKDTQEVAFAVRRLNQELIAAAPKEMAKFSRASILGRVGSSGLVQVAG